MPLIYRQPIYRQPATALIGAGNRVKVP